MNKFVRNICFYSFFGMIVLAAAACSPTRKIYKEPIREQGAAYLIDKLKLNELKFHTLSARFNLTFQTEKKKTNVSGIMRIAHDSLIWVSVTPALNLEAMRFELTPDTVKFLNRINETYFVDEFATINQLLNKTLDYDMAQAFLTGNDFSLYESNSFKAGIDNQQYKLSTTDRRKLKRYVRRSNDEISIPIQSIWLDPESFKISKVLLKEAERDSRKFEATYDKFVEIDGHNLPTDLIFRIETSKQKIKVAITYSKISIDQDITYPFRIPESYSRIEELHLTQ